MGQYEVRHQCDEDESLCRPDYEKECARLAEMVHELEDELEYWKDIASDLTEELAEYRIIMKTLEFVYGRKYEE